MWNTKVKVAAIMLLVIANGAYLYWVRVRRPALPAHMQEWQPLAERTLEERNQVIASVFALDDFNIKPLAAEGSSITIPRPEKWREQMLLLVNNANAGPAKVEDDKTPEESTLGALRANVILIAVSACETVPTQDTNSIFMKEKLVSRDAYMTSNGIPVPLLEFVTVGRLYVDEKDNTLVQTQSAVRVNGTTSMSFSAVVPHWLLPKRELTIGEKWVQVGVHPIGVPDTAPRPEIVRTLNRLVMFEGRRAAEVSSTATCYDFAPSPEGTHVKRVEVSVIYVDLETGEPLWYEARSENDREFSSLVRGCNQIFTKHLLRVPHK